MKIEGKDSFYYYFLIELLKAKGVISEEEHKALDRIIALNKGSSYQVLFNKIQEILKTM